jgi:hypothetical protein
MLVATSTAFDPYEAHSGVTYVHNSVDSIHAFSRLYLAVKFANNLLCWLFIYLKAV